MRRQTEIPPVVKPQYIIPPLYLAVVAGSIVFALMSKGTFAGLYAFILTFPWSMAFAMAIHYGTSFEPDVKGTLGLFVVPVSAAINASLLYMLLWFIYKERP